jgi:hypothetical protein
VVSARRRERERGREGSCGEREGYRQSASDNFDLLIIPMNVTSAVIKININPNLTISSIPPINPIPIKRPPNLRRMIETVVIVFAVKAINSERIAVQMVVLAFAGVSVAAIDLARDCGCHSAVVVVREQRHAVDCLRERREEVFGKGFMGKRQVEIRIGAGGLLLTMPIAPATGRPGIPGSDSAMAFVPA